MRRARRALLLAVFAAVATWALAPTAQAQPTTTPTTTAEAPDPTPTPEPPDDAEDLTDDEIEDEDTTADDGDDDVHTKGQEDEDLPSTGASVWLYGALGINILQVGWGLLLLEDRLRRDPSRRRRRRGLWSRTLRRRR